MEDRMNVVESLFERTQEFNRTSLELLKLKTVDKTAEVASTLVSHLATVIAVSSFLLALNIAIALWIGDLLGKSYYGFLIVAAFYGVAGIGLHFILQSRIQKQVNNSIIKQMLS